MSDNLPPGCSVSDIPGNRPEDLAFDKFIDSECDCLLHDFYVERKGLSEEMIGNYDFYSCYSNNEEFKDFVKYRFDIYYDGGM